MLSQSISLYKSLQKRYSRRINLDLKRINKVLKKLDNPHLAIKNPINIIGSDGKFSVLTSLKYFLEANKNNTSTFISPHLKDVRERISINKKNISTNKIKKLVKKIEKTNINLTLFELLTCVYILAVKEKKRIDYSLIESGLLFRKDSTNLWPSPKLQIITNINLQHLDWVKPKTLTEICKQKVGYLSQNTKIYIGKQTPKTLKIIKKILKKNLSKKIYSLNWKVIKKNKQLYYKDNKFLIPIKNKNIFSPALIENLCLAIKVALDLGVKRNTIVKTIPKIKFIGRINYIKKGKLKNIIKKNEDLLIDGCHSIKSAQNLYDYLKTLKYPIYGVWGMQKNKMAKDFLKKFNNIFKEIVTVKIPNESNALKSSQLKDIAFNLNYKVKSAPSIKQAIRKITSKEKKIIVIFGSLYLIGAALNEN